MRTSPQRLIEDLSLAGFGAWLATNVNGADLYFCGIITGPYLASAVNDAFNWIKERRSGSDA